MWTRPDTGDAPVSYAAPTFAAVKGIFESIVWLKSAEVVPTLVLQGVALAGLVLAIGLYEADLELLLVAVLVLLLKGVVLPWVLTSSVSLTGTTRDESWLNPTAGLIGVALLTMLAFVVASRVVTLFPVLHSLGLGHRASLVPAINLGQVSEFSLVILTLGAGDVWKTGEKLFGLVK